MPYNYKDLTYIRAALQCYEKIQENGVREQLFLIYENSNNIL